MRLFLVNVGVNAEDAARRGLRSPVFADGTFEFVPITERSDLNSIAGIATYADLSSHTGRVRNLGELVPEAMRALRAHVDPEFKTYTYGDILSSRAANLKHVRRGDLVWFLARLWEHNGRTWSGDSDFYLIGFLDVERNILVPAGTAPEGLEPEVRQRIRKNAHYKRMALAGDRGAFRVLVGNLQRSRRFNHAIRVVPEIAAHLFGGTFDLRERVFRRDGKTLCNKNGKPRRFESFGSITRSVQAFLDSEIAGDLEHIRTLAALAARHGRGTGA
jgi:hypothetical protein